MKLRKMSILGFLLGPLLFGVSLLLLPDGMFAFEARGAIGLMLWMMAWWIFRPVHLGVTALLPVALNAVFGFGPMDSVIASYAKPIFFLLLGTNFFAIAWAKTGVDRRIALRSLMFIGIDLRRQVLVWYVVATVLSMFLANVVVTATLATIALSMLAFVGEDDPQGAPFVLILLAIAWGAGLGGFGTPLGGGMNLVSLHYIEEFLGVEYGFGAWTLRMVPLLAVLTVLIGGYLMFLAPKGKKLTGADVFFEKEIQKLGAINRNEILVLGLFVAAILLSFLRPFYASLLPNLTPFFLFFIFGLSLFFIPMKQDKKVNEGDSKAEKILTWEFASPKILWGLLILFAGGLALGDLMIQSGAANAIASLISSMEISSPVVMLGIFVLMGIVLANISSNTAACSILMPIVLNISATLGYNVVAMLLLATVAANSAYILPTSVRAIPAGHGLAPIEFLKKGLPILGITFAALLGLGAMIFGWVPTF
jgi:sodium-dependent dicarboxylate transporter 2/3/5